MKTDLYTKIVLTVIALCLIILIVQNTDFIPQAQAHTIASPLRSEVIDVRIVDIDTYDALPVEIKSVSSGTTFDVNIAGIKSFLSLPVEIEKLDSFINPLPVKIKN